jgi:hypothetical protein
MLVIRLAQSEYDLWVVDLDGGAAPCSPGTVPDQGRCRSWWASGLEGCEFLRRTTGVFRSSRQVMWPPE